MKLFYRSVAVAIYAIILAAATMNFSAAQSKSSNVGLRKISVPANIVKGSSVTTGRVFYKSTLPEATLAGIRLGRNANDILIKWGNPTRITIGASRITAPALSSGPAFTPAMGGGFGMPGGIGATMQGLQNMYSSALAGDFSAGPPPLPTFTNPAATLPAVTQPSAEPQPETQVQDEITWTYDLPNGITLEFVITQGIITQITVGGRGPWSLSKTRTGLQLGDTYKLVLWVNGYPETQNYVGRFLSVGYINQNRALFTFLNNKLVGVTIAMVPTELM
ncbi:MAG: hypothetical protein SNJ70_00640 [Armatimonadota bacterium]